MKNGNYTKYSDYSKNNNKEVTTETEPEVTTETEPEVTTETEPEVTTETEPEVTTETEFIYDEINDMYFAGVVSAAKLNVRKEPNIDSEVLCVITKDTPVSVNACDCETYDNFYKITVINENVEVEGYCMKEFINIQ